MEDKDIFTIRGLMKVLKLTRRGIEKHLYEIRDLHATGHKRDDRRRTLLFDLAEVERFQRERRKRGRPRKARP